MQNRDKFSQGACLLMSILKKTFFVVNWNLTSKLTNSQINLKTSQIFFYLVYRYWFMLLIFWKYLQILKKHEKNFAKIFILSRIVLQHHETGINQFFWWCLSVAGSNIAEVLLLQHFALSRNIPHYLYCKSLWVTKSWEICCMFFWSPQHYFQIF